MRKLIRLAICGSVILGGACLGQSNKESPDLSVLRMLPPEKAMVFGIQWHKLASSLTGSLVQKNLDSSAPAAAFFLGLANLEKILREDIDALYLCGSGAASPKPAGQSTGLVIVTGRFDPARVRSWFPGKTEVYRGVSLVVSSGAKPSTTRVALLDRNILLLGERKEMMGAIDRWRAPARQPRGMAARALKLAARRDVWFVADALPAGTKTGGPTAAISSELKGLEMGISLSKGFDMEATLQAKSEEAAGSLLAAVRGFLAMAEAKQDVPPESVEALRKLQISQDQSSVSLSLFLTEAEVQKLQAAAQKSPPRAVTAASPAKDQPAQRKTIRIIGQENGPVEVPMHPH